MKNFWQELKKNKKESGKPIVVLAPMADVTDVSFRMLFAKYGKPDVTWTEFVSADGLVMAPDDNADESGLSSKQKLLKDLEFTEGEKPIVAQLFSSHTERMEKAAKLCQDLGFDGIDINMGCPDRSIERQGCGSAMIKNPEKALEIIEVVKRGAPNIPVSVKTRLGYNQDQVEEWIPTLLKADIACLTVHLRTRKEMSKVPAHWDRMKRIVELRDQIAPQTLILGNGDVTSLEDADLKTKETGCDGVMIGRGIFGNPWFFNRETDRDKDVSIEERLRVMVEHTKLFEEKLPHKSFALMKKHYKAYVDGFAGAKELRIKLMEANNSGEVEEIVDTFICGLQ